MSKSMSLSCMFKCQILFLSGLVHVLLYCIVNVCLRSYSGGRCHRIPTWTAFRRNGNARSFLVSTAIRPSTKQPLRTRALVVCRSPILGAFISICDPNTRTSIPLYPHNLMSLKPFLIYQGHDCHRKPERGEERKRRKN
jgi:hypothetical protein